MTVYFVEHFLKNKDVSLKLREEFVNMGARGQEVEDLMKVYDELKFQGKKCLQIAVANSAVLTSAAAPATTEAAPTIRNEGQQTQKTVDE